MKSDQTGRIQYIASNDLTGPEAGGTPDQRERLLVVSTELSRRALELPALEDLQFLVTNDIRTLIAFDRCTLVTHFGGISRLAAVSSQPILEKKAKLYKELTGLAVHVRGLPDPVLLSAKSEIPNVTTEKLGLELKDALQSYMETSECTGLLLVPLNINRETVGHLMFEYFDERLPDRITIQATLRVAPFLASALTQRWLLEKKPGLPSLTEVSSMAYRPMVRFAWRYLPLLAIAAAVLVYALYVVPVPYTVGGEAEVIPHRKHVAFCKIDGLVHRIHIAEGSTVKEGQVLATLDPAELDYRIDTDAREIALLTNKVRLLKVSAAEDPSKLAESKLMDIKRKSVLAELEHLRWQRQFLEITAPASGIILTKEVDTLVGKKFRAGEAFCEIAEPGDFLVEVCVPEERVSQVKVGQDASLYLNNEPLKAYALRVREVSPRADALPRLGNIYRVRASFENKTPPLKTGMKGIGKIRVGTAKLWSIVTDRLATRWNQLSLYLW